MPQQLQLKSMFLPKPHFHEAALPMELGRDNEQACSWEMWDSSDGATLF